MRRVGVFVVAALAVAFVTGRAEAVTAHGLSTGVFPATETDPARDAASLARIRSAGARFVRMDLLWSEVAPAVRPATFRPEDPAEPSYNWAYPDARIARIRAAGLEPIVSTFSAPKWAERTQPLSGWPGTGDPDPIEFGRFARAAAERYGGTFRALPRVRYWSAWNEPNLSIFFYPQLTPGGPVSPGWYRETLNAFAVSVHGVHADNVVLAGETAPFRDISPYVLALDKDWGPLKFMRQLLCVSDSGAATCDKKASFDVWSTHPYTSGGPTHHAALPYDVSLGDLPKMRATLAAAVRAGHIRSARPPRLWVTEFSWDSNPPDPCSPPIALLKRWVPEAMYRMWASDVDVVTWFLLMDLPMRLSFFQSGLYSYAPTIEQAKAKAFLPGFRFPFVAFRRGAGVYVWAHTPLGRRGRITVEQSRKGRWKLVKSLTTDRYGVAQGVLQVKPVGEFRATSAGERSLPFSMRVEPDRFFNPFGLTLLLEPNGTPCSS